MLIFAALINEVTKIEVTPEVISASDDLIFLDPDRRGCYFSDEGNLTLINKYSQVGNTVHLPC